MKYSLMWAPGVDFGWVNGSSGVCALWWDGQRLSLRDLGLCATHAEVLAWLAGFPEGCDRITLAIDAPLVIPNATGMRISIPLRDTMIRSTSRRTMRSCSSGNNSSQMRSISENGNSPA
jgi:predicted RNase H-like nuclease